MSIKLKKLLLLLLIVPSGFLWAGMCFLGISIFFHGMFRDFGSFFLSLLSLIGLFCVVTAIVASIRYPKINALSVYSALLGIAAIVVGVYIGVPFAPLLLASAVSLMVGGIFLVVEYVRGT
ncbi:hypothetical protein ACJJH9_00040 (plasmid) [Microbulbifer sp. DLAB2-AF]|uniref:hypothetical protein n=1 Tax=Microbulbifer sp. DLAB2-AF TaxID=3243395 RepID=UPI004039965E